MFETIEIPMLEKVISRRKKAAKIRRQIRAGRIDLSTELFRRFLLFGMNEAIVIMPKTCEFKMKSVLLSEDYYRAKVYSSRKSTRINFWYIWLTNQVGDDESKKIAEIQNGIQNN